METDEMFDFRNMLFQTYGGFKKENCKSNLFKTVKIGSYLTVEKL